MMFCFASIRHAVAAAVLGVALAAGTTLAKPAEATFYEAYYLEHERGDLETAAGLYAGALEAGGLAPALETQARAGLAACREEIACADFARLMPPETLAYLEVNNPGDQLGELLNMLGLLAGTESASGEAPGAGGKHVAISPVLIKELVGIRGLAAAVTGVDLRSQTPAGVAVFHPGSMDAIRGLLETALPAAAETVKPIQGHPTYCVEEKVYVCLTSRLVIVSPQRPQIVAVLRRLAGKTDKSFAANEAMAEVLRERENAAVFFCVNAQPIVPILTGLAPASHELAMADALVDFNSLKWIAGRSGVDERGVFSDLEIRLDRGHHNVFYNLMRTPPITRQTLGCIPKGAAGFLAAALGDAPARGRGVAPEAGGAPPAVIGLDFGREIFANIVDFAVYALPPAGDAGSVAGPVPDVAAVIRVNDPAKSQALWTQILGIASMAAGAPSTDGKAEPIGGAEVRTYKFPEGVTVFFTTLDDNIVVAATRYAMQRALEATGGGESILADEAFAASLARINEHTSKALFVHPGRCFEVAKKFMSPHEVKEAEPVVAMLTDLVASVLTDEAEDLFHVSAAATGLPDVSDFVAQMLQREEHEKRMHRDLRHAMRANQWDKALTALDTMAADDPDNPRHLQSRFEILATGKKDREAALACAEAFLKKAARNADALNSLAWELLTEDRYEGRYNDLAAAMAEKACELTNHRNWSILDTLALAKFKTGDVERAIELQKKAVGFPGGDRKDTRKRLARYEAAKNEAADARSGSRE